MRSDVNMVYFQFNIALYAPICVKSGNNANISDQ